MDLFAVLLVTCVSFFVGAIVTVALQYYVLYSYFKKSPVAKKTSEKFNWTEYNLPESLKKHLETDDLNNKSGGSSLPISLVLQFLFHELRHSEAIKRWLYKKLSLEFEELLTKTTIGKFFETIKIKDMNLGSQFPDIKEITVEDVKLDKKDGHIDTINLCLNLDYTGNFLLSIDAKMKFGKTAFLSIRVKKVSGLARLQFTRYPYTHWSFSFYNEPTIELAVESHFQGRQLQSNITNLVVNQIKKAIRRKHTLPNYKIRYKPFFLKTDPSQLDSEDSEIIPQGLLEVSCIEVSRLEVPPTVQNVYCTFAVDSIPWICVYEDKSSMILEVTVTKLRQAQLGVIFRQEQSSVIIDSVSPHGCAHRSGLKPGDVVLAVESKPINSVPQVAKFIKSVNSANVTLRIERNIEAKYIMKNPNSNPKPEVKISPVPSTDVEEPESEDNFVVVESVVKKSKCLANLEKLKSPSNENMSKLAQTIGNFSLRKRKTSISDKKDNSDSSAKNTPNSSGPGTPQHANLKQMQVPTLLAKKLSISEVPEIIRTDLETLDTELLTGGVEITKGKDMNANPLIFFNDDYQFPLKEGLKYLNINVWGTTSDEKDVLLGYTNIPLTHILNECCNSVLGHYMRSYSFLPPGYTQPTNQSHPLMSHSGFEHVFCYGDVLLSIIWNHEEEIELKRKLSTVTLESDTKSTNSTVSINNNKHDFIRTQFHRTTHCDFCSKKIWLKDAVQCRECGLCCHKKCIVKCQTSTGCIPLKSDSSELLQNESPDDDVNGVDQESRTFTNEAVGSGSSNGGSPAAGMKRVNSANNLAIPGSYMSGNSSKSLPQSPQRTPSRKQSITNLNPFALCPGVLDDVQKAPEEASENVNRLLEQIMLCPNDEALMDAAKETGRQLYSSMPHEERVEKINSMMAELKKTLDAVTMEHMELSKRMSQEESETEKTKLAFLMGQADAKVHGLSVLMLHYCSSLQYTQEKIV